MQTPPALGLITRVTRIIGAALLGLGVLGASALGGAPASGQTPPASATVTVVHGLRGQLVDVYLDGKLALKGFQPERVTDPLQLPAGKHEVKLRSAGSAATSAPFATANVTVPAGANLSLVAHLGQDGKPTVTPFNNKVNPLAAGKARLVARNTAFVEPVTVLLNGAPVVTTLKPKSEFGADVAPATYQVSVKAPSGGVLVPANDVPVPEGAATIMYLIGARADNSLIWIAQSIVGLQQPPAAVPTGNSGLAAVEGAQGSGPSPIGTIGLVLSLSGLGVGFLLWRRPRTV